MVHINDHYLKLKAGYLFPEIARRVEAFAEAHPQADVIRLGIGDVVKGIPRPMVDAMKEAVEEMAHDDTLQGYPPDQGQDFLREAIVEHDFGARGVQVHSDEIFVSDGSKCDSGAVQEIFRRRLRGRADRSGLSGVLRFQRHGRSHGASRREWFVCRYGLHVMYGR